MIISLFETARLSVSTSPRNLYDSLKSIKERMFISPIKDLNHIKYISQCLGDLKRSNNFTCINIYIHINLSTCIYIHAYMHTNNMYTHTHLHACKCTSICSKMHTYIYAYTHIHRQYTVSRIPGLATYFRFSFRFFKKGSCQLLAKVCARSTG